MRLFNNDMSTQVQASISLMSDGLRYLELEGNVGKLRIAKAMTAELPAGNSATTIGDTAKMNMLLDKLQESSGGIGKASVNVGIPTRDVMFRVVEMPGMELEEAKEALQWDFDKYFPFPAAEAVYDLATLEQPGNDEGNKIKYMVAASRMRPVEVFLESISRIGLNVAGVEPLQVGMLRASVGPIPTANSGYIVVYFEKQSTQIIVGYKSSGLLFRSLMVGMASSMEKSDAIAAIIREISSTLAFARGQFRDLKIENIIISGETLEGEDISGNISLQIPDIQVRNCMVWEQWGIKEGQNGISELEALLGLAVRDII